MFMLFERNFKHDHANSILEAFFITANAVSFVFLVWFMPAWEKSSHMDFDHLFSQKHEPLMEAYNWTGSYNNEQERSCANVHLCVWILHVGSQQAISHTCAPPRRAPFQLPFTAAHSPQRGTTLPKFASLLPNHGDERIQRNFWESAVQKKNRNFWE